MSNKTNETEIEKVINKHFNNLEDKVSNLSKELTIREIENLPDKKDSRFSPFVSEIYNEGKHTVKEYLKGNLKEFGSAENDEYKVVILNNFKMLYIKKDNPNYPVPVGSWMDWWEYDHGKYFGVNEKYYKILPINKRAELESKLQLKLWIDKEYYSSYAKFYLPQEQDKWWWDEGGASKQIKDFNYGNEYWKQKLQKSKPQSTQLIGKDIFDITTTGMSYYDAMIQKGHIAGNRDPVEYFKTNKGLVFEIIYMSPEDYINKSIDIRYPTSNNIFVKEEVLEAINKENVNEYKERTLSGSKMPMPVLDYNDMSQEGRHRAVVAMELDVEEIPVLVVRSYEGLEESSEKIIDVLISEINTEFEGDAPSFSNVISIMKAIQRNEKIPPILVSPNKYLQDGRHRLAAYKNLGYKTIPAIIGYNIGVYEIIKDGNPIELEEREYKGQKYKTPKRLR